MPGKYRDISRYLGLKVQANIVFRYRDIYTKGNNQSLSIAARSRLRRLEWSAVRAQIQPYNRTRGHVHAERWFDACIPAVRVGRWRDGWGSRGHAQGGHIPSLSSIGVASARTYVDALYLMKFHQIRVD